MLQKHDIERIEAALLSPANTAVGSTVINAYTLDYEISNSFMNQSPREHWSQKHMWLLFVLEAEDG